MSKPIAPTNAAFLATPNRRRIADWPWRKILADAGLLAAFVLTSSLLSLR